MNDKTELLWRLAVAVEVAERQDSIEQAKRLRIQFHRHQAGRRVRMTIVPRDISAALSGNGLALQHEN